MTLYTIGFTQKTAERFFELLRAGGVTLRVDTRLRPDTQLSGFAKRCDLPYFTRELIGASYLHRPDLAPSADILDGYRSSGDWGAYAEAYRSLMRERGFPGPDDRRLFSENVCCLMCSEHEPTHCHRRLLAEIVGESWGDIESIHLV